MDEATQNLIQACSAGDLTALQAQLDNLPTPLDLTSNPPQLMLAAAIQKKNLNIVTYLLSRYPTLPIGDQPARDSCRTGSIPIYSLLLERDPTLPNRVFEFCTPDGGGCFGTTLSNALLFRPNVSLDFLTTLLTSGADPNLQDRHPNNLSLLTFHDNTEYSIPRLSLLIEYGAALEGSGVLCTAVHRGNMEILKWLLANGAHPENDNDDSCIVQTPALNVAVEKGERDMARLLVENGADPGRVDRLKVSAWDLAGGREEWLEILRGVGSTGDLKDEKKC